MNSMVDYVEMLIAELRYGVIDNMLSEARANMYMYPEELRFNPYHDPSNGRFTSGGGGGSGGSAGNDTKSDFELTKEERRSILNDKITNGEILLRIREQKQNTHRKGTPQYVEGNSYVTVDNTELQNLVDTKHSTGKIFIINNGNHIREVVKSDKPIGVNVDLEKNTEEITSTATIHYSKKGTHVVPAHEREKSK